MTRICPCPKWMGRMTTGNVHILDVDLINQTTEVFIAYESGDSIVNENKRKRFGKYQIGKDTLLEFSDLHEKILELEKQLMVDTVQHTL